MGGFQHVYLSGQCGQIILLALPAHCPPHCTALPSISIAHSQVICEFASFVAEFMAQIPATRRELQQRSLPQLKALAEELALPSSGRKSPIIDRLYRHHRQAAVTTDLPARDRAHPRPTPARHKPPRVRRANRPRPT